MKLIYNKIITPRGSVGTSKKNKHGVGGSIDYSYFDPSKRTKGGETIGRNIQWYRMWWMYLRLALECEEKNILINGEKIKMNRRYYRQWNLDSILTNSFDSWWKENKRLFVHPQIKTLSASSVPDDDHIVLMIPKTRDKTDLLRELDGVLEGKTKSVIQFPFSKSKATYLRSHMQYNIFVKATNGESRGQIREWVNEKYKPMSVPGILGGGLLQTKYNDQGEKIENILENENSVSNSVRYAKNRIVSTSRGVFP
jgi:hypothetical protein|tara:strand:+ start:1213 stop:1974 length:762 start_codon:yes stop_codon:yes gene_type:complete